MNMYLLDGFRDNMTPRTVGTIIRTANANETKPIMSKPLPDVCHENLIFLFRKKFKRSLKKNQCYAVFPDRFCRLKSRVRIKLRFAEFYKTIHQTNKIFLLENSSLTYCTSLCR